MKYSRLLSLFTILSSLLFASQASDPPNIVIIYADDLGYGDVQIYNPERGKIPTPHIDRMAREGMRFTDAHSSSGVCSPSRYTLLTGRYHWRTRLQRGIVSLWGPPVIPPERLTIAGLAKQAGYQTTCIGKWHLGWNWPIEEEDKEWFLTGGYGGEKDLTATAVHREAWKRAFTQPITGGPTANGFDTYFGTDVPNWPPYCYIENERTIGIPTEYADVSLFEKNQASIQGPALNDWTLETILPELRKRASEYIRESAPKDDPYLIYLPLTSPHTPLSVNSEWEGKSGLGLYADFVMETDAVVGQVLQAIDDSGEAENTFVLFTSDNGCAPYIDVESLEKQGHYPSGPLRGYKSDAWEGGHRVAFIARWPKVISRNTINRQLVHQADLLATIADIVDQELPANAGEDSFSFLSLLQGSDQPIRQHAVSCSIRGLPSIRDGQWKLIVGPGSGGWTDGSENEAVQLYNLADDLGETRNLAEQHPERVADMTAVLESYIQFGRSSKGPAQHNDIDVVRYPLQ
jgi:arylsulfatase A